MPNWENLEALADYGVSIILALAVLMVAIGVPLFVIRRGRSNSTVDSSPAPPTPDAVSPMADALKSIAEYLKDTAEANRASAEGNRVSTEKIIPAIEQIQRDSAEQNKAIMEQSQKNVQAILEAIANEFRSYENRMAQSLETTTKGIQTMQDNQVTANKQLCLISDQLVKLNETIVTAMAAKQELSQEDRTLMSNLLDEVRALREAIQRQNVAVEEAAKTPAPETIAPPADTPNTGG